MVKANIKKAGLPPQYTIVNGIAYPIAGTKASKAKGIAKPKVTRKGTALQQLKTFMAKPKGDKFPQGYKVTGEKASSYTKKNGENVPIKLVTFNNGVTYKVTEYRFWK